MYRGKICKIFGLKNHVLCLLVFNLTGTIPWQNNCANSFGIYLLPFYKRFTIFLNIFANANVKPSFWCSVSIQEPQIKAVIARDTLYSTVSFSPHRFKLRAGHK